MMQKKIAAGLAVLLAAGTILGVRTLPGNHHVHAGKNDGCE